MHQKVGRQKQAHPEQETQNDAQKFPVQQDDCVFKLFLVPVP